MIINYMELLVNEIYNEVKSLYGNCDEKYCVHDIKSMALNNLPPAYFNSDIPEETKKAFLLDRQRRIAVLAKVAEAADSVCSDCPDRKRR